MSWGGKRIRYSEYKDLKIGQKLGGKLNVGQKCGKICKNMQGQIGGEREKLSRQKGECQGFLFSHEEIQMKYCLFSRTFWVKIVFVS